jgi:hypothetical protein
MVLFHGNAGLPEWTVKYYLLSMFLYSLSTGGIISYCSTVLMCYILFLFYTQYAFIFLEASLLKGII